ncbi:MAG: sigma-70 family RNA polymerase sigma factor [Wenzhouxiangella sp.]
MPASQHTARFEALVQSHADDLFRFGCWLTGDREVAKDLVQETMIRAWRSIDQLREPCSVKPWLMTTLRRENARRFERKRLDLVDIEHHPVVDHDEVGVEARILHSQIRVELDRLPKKYAEPLRLQAYLGCSIAEITQRLGISRSAAMTRVHRARQQLKDRLSADHGLAAAFSR